jgi:NAD(P)-dependent dehydrogenase (short-subunit alcohol dehydrogenase family)
MITQSSNKHLVWFITGTSQGFGRELVQAALDRGDSVVATSRQPQKVAGLFPDQKDRLLAVPMDLSNPAQIQSAVDEALSLFGKIDVLVNNAGHGLLGAVEEATDAEIANVFEINVFGLIRVTQAVLPHFRKQHSGHVINLSSIGGLVGLPGWGIYNSTKFAVEGLSEALAEELTPLGIRVTLVEPGPFRTDFLGGSLATADRQIEDYVGTAGKTRDYATQRNQKQPGDPTLAAQAIVKVILSEHPPLHLPLGAFAHQRALAKLDQLRQEFTDWQEVALATDFSDSKAG